MLDHFIILIHAILPNSSIILIILFILLDVHYHPIINYHCFLTIIDFILNLFYLVITKI